MAIFLLVAGLGIANVHRNADRSAHRSADKDARSAASLAATQLAISASAFRTSVGALAANPKLPTVVLKPASCTLSFTRTGPTDRGHLDVIRADGTVVCSSSPPSRRPIYQSAAWFEKAQRAPVLLAPVRDARTGALVALLAAPSTSGVVAAFVDLSVLGPELAKLYSDGGSVEFLLTSADGRTLITRSIDPRASIGRSLAGTGFAINSTMPVKSIDGTRRIYAEQPVAGTGWRLFAGSDVSASLAAARHLEKEQIAIILVGLLAMLLAMLLTYRRVARPLRNLSAAVKNRGTVANGVAIPVHGPTEVVELGAAVDDLVASVQRELADREQAEEHANSLAEIVESSDDAIFSKTLDGVVTSWNRGAEQMYGYSEAEIIGKNVAVLADPCRRGESAEFLSAVKSGEAIKGHETIRVRKDGTSIDVSLTISPLRDRNGVITGASTIARDVTERNRTELALEQSQASYRMLFQEHPTPVWVVDENMRFLAVNDAMVATYGYSEHELMSMTVDTLRPPETREALRKLFEDPNRERFERGVQQHVTKDGALIEVDVATSVIDFDGRPARLVLARDITEQRSLEAQLRQAQKMEAVGQLAGGIAHDFNNMLTAILGHADLASRSDDLAEVQGLVQGVLAAGSSAASLTRQLLAFSRQQVLQPKVVDIRDTVIALDSLLRRLLGDGIELKTNVKDDLSRILVDPSQLEQALLNLVINARDAMPDGGRVTIDLRNVQADDAYCRARPGLRPGSYIGIAVTDSGIGMDEATRSRIFEPFYTTKPDGTGLGLATTFGIVKQSGGYISVYSEPGRGTTFRLLFPAVDAQVEPVSALEPEATNGTRRGGRVLVIEDEPLVREVVTMMLTGRGFEVITASSPDEARELALAPLSSPFDLILCDVMLDGHSGPELAKELLRAHPTAACLFTSGYAYGDGLHPEDFNGIAFLAKPFTGPDLAAKIDEVLHAK